MYRSRIHLIGGGPGTLTALRRHLRMALLPLGGKKKPLVAYVGAASGDDAGFQHMIGQEIERAGGRLRGVKLASPRAKLAAARAVLEDSDVVFVSGGDVEAGMDVLQQRGVLPLFHRLAEEGRPMIGISAGSIMLGRAWVRFPDGEGSGHEPSLFACMGVAPVHVDAHAEDDGWSELRTFLRLVQRREPAAVGYGLTKKGGIVIEPGEEGATILPFGTDAPRFAVRKGRVVVVAPLRLGSSAPAAEKATRRRAGGS